MALPDAPRPRAAIQRTLTKAARISASFPGSTALWSVEIRLVEAAGIEPASEGDPRLGPTCVALGRIRGGCPRAGYRRGCPGWYVLFSPRATRRNGRVR